MASWHPLVKHEETIAAASIATAPVVCLPVCAIGQGGFAWALLLPLLAAAMVTFIWRVALIGVSTNDTGIRVRHVLRSDVIPWSEVVQIWAGPAREQRATAIWVSTASRHIETPFWLGDTKVRHRHRIRFRQNEFDDLLLRLREEHAHHQART